MKKKIAFFANGWSESIIKYFLDGLMNTLPEDSADIFMFLGHAMYANNEVMQKCESTIYELPNLKDFDAAIVFGSSLNFNHIRERVYSICLESGIPVISVCFKHNNCINITSDNRVGMKQLCDHLFDTHNVKTVKYIAGSKEHPDSMLRQTVLEESMEEHGLTLSEDDVYYSNWEPIKVVAYLRDKNITKEMLPDVIVCANDQLAEATINVLFEQNILVPEDVIVTGFDCNPEGQIFFPALSTVSQNHFLMGEETAKILADMTNIGDISVPSAFICSESCGCTASYTDGKFSPRDLYLRDMPRSKEMKHAREIRLHEIEWAVSRSDTFEDLSKSLQEILYASDRSEGISFHILINPSFKEFNSGVEELCFSPRMEVIVSKTDGVPYLDKEFNSRQLIPGYTGTGANHVYTFLSLFPGEETCGYVVITDHTEYLNGVIFKDFTDTISRGMESCQKSIRLNLLNAKLSELMQQDILTQVKNRVAYEKYISRFEDDLAGNNLSDFAVIMFDVNNLKQINDKYGHEMGDTYLKNCCKMICDSFKHSPIFRVGGDEFVAILQDTDYKERNSLIEKMRAKMESLSQTKLQPWDIISIAGGLAEYNKGSNESIKDVIKRADMLMYENKKQMKAAFSTTQTS